MKGDTLETIGHAAMAFVVIFAVVLLSGICFAGSCFAAMAFVVIFAVALLSGSCFAGSCFAAMAFVVIFAVVLLSGICFAAAWRQECMACHKERPHVKAYICPECKKAALEAEKEDK